MTRLKSKSFAGMTQNEIDRALIRRGRRERIKREIVLWFKLFGLVGFFLVVVGFIAVEVFWPFLKTVAVLRFIFG